MKYRILIGTVLLGLCGLGLAQEAPEAAPQDPNQELQARIDRGVENTANQLTKQYELSESQQASAREMLRQHADTFMQENREPLSDLMQRGRELQQFMRDSGAGWQGVPDEIKKDLAERILPVIDAAGKQMGSFSDDLGTVLTDEQRQKLADSRKQFERQLMMARLQVRVMGGLAAPGEQVATPGGGPDGSADPNAASQRPGGQRAAARAKNPVDTWDAYVQNFIRKYHLDEIQKTHALDLLAEYKDKAQQVPQPATQPAGPPATRPQTVRLSAEDFRSLLQAVQVQRRPLVDLFEQLKAELDKIPSPVQRQLAEENAASRPAGARSAQE